MDLRIDDHAGRPLSLMRHGKSWRCFFASM
jgi:hypothetical protein